MSDIGETLRFKTDITDANGALANAQTVSLTVALPDGTSSVLAPTNPPAITGKYVHDFTPTLAGRHTGAWLFTFAGGNTASYVETFDVGGGLITVDEAVAHLRAQGVITGPDDLEQLQWLCLVATDAVERDLGRVMVRRTITEVYDGGQYCLILRNTPVASITSVVDSGTTLGINDYTLDTGSGILYRGSTTYRAGFTTGRNSVVVTYVAGYTDPPRVVRMAALTLVQSMWQQSQQAFHPGIDESGEAAFTSAAIASLSQIPGYESLRAVGVA